MPTNEKALHWVNKGNDDDVWWWCQSLMMQACRSRVNKLDILFLFLVLKNATWKQNSGNLDEPPTKFIQQV